MALPFHSNGLIAVSKTPEIINSQVIFGTPSRNCSGSGICKVYTIHGSKRLNISCEMVKAGLMLVKAQLQMSFPKAGCSEQLIQQQFATESFKVEENFVLPTWLSRKFQLPAVFVPIGEYPIMRQNDFIGLNLPLRPFYSPS